MDVQQYAFDCLANCLAKDLGQEVVALRNQFGPHWAVAKHGNRRTEVAYNYVVASTHLQSTAHT